MSPDWREKIKILNPLFPHKARCKLDSCAAETSLSHWKNSDICLLLKNMAEKRPLLLQEACFLDISVPVSLEYPMYTPWEGWDGSPALFAVGEMHILYNTLFWNTCPKAHNKFLYPLVSISPDPNFPILKAMNLCTCECLIQSSECVLLVLSIPILSFFIPSCCKVDFLPLFYETPQIAMHDACCNTSVSLLLSSIKH